MKFVKLFMLVLILVTTTQAQFISTASGGIWSDKDTWENSDTYPKAGDDVIIVGKVYGTGECNNLTIRQTGLLERVNITVNGNLINEGTIRNAEPGSTSGAYSIVTVFGNLKNTGHWHTSETLLRGEGTHTHTLYIGDQAYSDFGVLKNYPSTSTCIVNADTTAIYITNCTINLGENGILNLSGNKKITFDDSKLWYSKINLNGGEAIFKNLSGISLNGALQDGTIKDTLNIGTGSCRMFGTIINEGVVRDNLYGNSTVFDVKGNLTNNGVFRDNENADTADYRWLNVKVSGEFINNGQMLNSRLELTGDENQNISFNQDVNIKEFVISDAVGSVIAKTDLRFHSTNLSGNKGTLKMEGKKLYNDGESSYYDITINNADLRGKNRLSYYVSFTGNLIINDTLMDKSNDIVADIKCPVVNNGTIINNPENATGNLTLNIHNDLKNNNIWDNYSTVFVGKEDQNISLINHFSGKYLKDTDSNSAVIALTPLRFENTIVDLGSYNTKGKLVLSDSTGIMLLGDSSETHMGYLSHTNLIANNNNVEFDKGSYISYSNIKDAELNGTVALSSDVVFKGVTLNKGILTTKFTGNNVKSIIEGDFINIGQIIKNGNYQLYFNAYGNVTNKGYWKTSRLDLDGSKEQVVCINSNSPINSNVYFHSMNGSGAYQWYKDNAVMEGKKYQYFMKDSLTANDNGNYYCLSSTDSSRNIIIYPKTLMASYYFERDTVWEDTVRAFSTSKGFITNYRWENSGVISEKKNLSYWFEPWHIFLVKHIVSDGVIADTAYGDVLVLPYTTADVNKNEDIPSTYFINQNYPNPFNPATKIKFGIPEEDNVKIEVYNVLGEKIETLINEYLPAGSYTLDFDGEKFSSGVYYYLIKTQNYTETKKMLLVK